MDVQERLWSYFNLVDILPVWCYCIKKITFLPLCKYSPGGNDEQRNNGNNLWYRFNFSFYTLIQLQLIKFHGPLPQQWLIHICVSGLESSVLYHFVKIHYKNTNLENFNFQHSWVENKKNLVGSSFVRHTKKKKPWKIHIILKNNDYMWRQILIMISVLLKVWFCVVKWFWTKTALREQGFFHWQWVIFIYDAGWS